MFSVATRQRAERVNATLVMRGEMIVTVESCTGGLIAGALTDVSGSSAAVYGGFVTYDNGAKIGMVGVDPDLIHAHGAVSEQVARAMAEGGRKASGGEVSIAVTGIAGPGGGTEGKPVGLVYFACTTAAGTVCIKEEFGDIGRQQVREATVNAALDLVLKCLGVSR